MDAWSSLVIIFDNIIAYSSSCIRLFDETNAKQVASSTDINMVNESRRPVLPAGGNLLNDTVKKTTPEVNAAPQRA